MNHGRWLIQCPECSNWHEVREDGEQVFCVICYPGLNAVVYQPLDKDNLARGFRPVKDAATRQATRAQALAEGNYLVANLPAQSKAIEKILRVRPVKNRNWDLGESLDVINNDNVKHGLPRVEV
jgi:hypothetical protein